MVLNLLRLHKEIEVICTWYVLYLITDIVKVILFYIRSNDSLLPPDILVLLGYSFALLRFLRHNFVSHKVWVALGDLISEMTNRLVSQSSVSWGKSAL